MSWRSEEPKSTKSTTLLNRNQGIRFLSIIHIAILFVFTKIKIICNYFCPHLMVIYTTTENCTFRAPYEESAVGRTWTQPFCDV